MVKRCVELDPSVPDFHHLLACMSGFIGDSKNILKAVYRAIELLPNQPGWLYDRSTHVRLRDEKEKKQGKNIYSGDDAAEAYLKFILSNPMDHCKYPEACYSLSQIYALSGEKIKAKMFYHKGLEAEDFKIRLHVLHRSKTTFRQK